MYLATENKPLVFSLNVYLKPRRTVFVTRRVWTRSCWRENSQGRDSKEIHLIEHYSTNTSLSSNRVEGHFELNLEFIYMLKVSWVYLSMQQWKRKGYVIIFKLFKLRIWQAYKKIRVCCLQLRLNYICVSLNFFLHGGARYWRSTFHIYRLFLDQPFIFPSYVAASRARKHRHNTLSQTNINLLTARDFCL